MKLAFIPVMLAFSCFCAPAQSQNGVYVVDGAFYYKTLSAAYLHERFLSGSFALDLARGTTPDLPNSL